MRTVLIANRAEIASRVARSCRALGLESVAIHSDPDAQLPYVRDADRAVSIGGASPDTSYLDIGKIIAAAERTGADAIHPGYGFLAENAEFAKRVLASGLIWVGPPPEAIEAMGNKAAARKLAAQHDVPTVTGYDADDQSIEAFTAAAEEIGFPLLVKAVAGGGGRGMRRVESLDELEEAVNSARREAESAFGDGRCLLERYVLQPRHVEVQVLADSHGNVLHLFERECSVQRRHQKILEEAPSPVVTPELRARLGEAAVKIAAAAGYVGAGTAEFLVSGDDFYFLEMNTRLQVEHPVTELITGHDLVELQLRIARGEPLPFAQDDLSIDGHAIEARLYGEDPLRDYLPATGTLLRLDLPKAPGVRLDVGYEAGNAIGIHYDSMIAKLIVWGPDRETANARLRRLLERAWVPGIINNLPLLREISAHPAWATGDLNTAFLSEHGLPTVPPANLTEGAIGALALLWLDARARFPAELPLGFRVEGRAQSTRVLHQGESTVTLSWRGDSPITATIAIGEGEPVEHQVVVHGRDGDHIDLTLDGIRASWRVVRVGDQVYTHTGQVESFVAVEPRFPAPGGAEEAPGSCTASTPGTVIGVHVEVGQEVAEGDRLVTLEAMKMEHVLKAPAAGTVSAVRVEEGDTVDQGDLLVQVDLDDAE